MLSLSHSNLHGMRGLKQVLRAQGCRAEADAENMHVHAALHHVTFLSCCPLNPFPLLCRGGRLMSYPHQLSIGKQMLDALLYLHLEAGILHLDVKPENVLVNIIAPPKKPQGSSGSRIEAKLCDFGLAERMSTDGRVTLPCWRFVPCIPCIPRWSIGCACQCAGDELFI